MIENELSFIRSQDMYSSIILEDNIRDVATKYFKVHPYVTEITLNVNDTDVKLLRVNKSVVAEYNNCKILFKL